MQQRLDFIVRKLACSVLTLIAVLIFNFFLFRIVPGDPVQMISSPRMRPETRDRIRQQFGLDRLIWFNLQEARESGDIAGIFDSQFFYYVRNLSRGELGESFPQRRPAGRVCQQ